MNIKTAISGSLECRRNDTRRSAVRRSGEQGKVAAFVHFLEPGIRAVKRYAGVCAGQIWKNVRDGIAATAIGHCRGQSEVRVCSKQTKDFAADISASAENDCGDGHDFKRSVSVRRSAIESPSATPLLSALIAGKDNRSLI